MEADKFRALALDLPETSESAHMEHPDFRIGGRVFATLGPDGTWGMVKLAPQDQELLTRLAPDAFEPFAGAWGRQGATKVILESAEESTVGEALIAAWRNVAPKRVVESFDKGIG